MHRSLHLFTVSLVLLSLLITSIFPPQTVSASPLQAPAIAITMTDTLIDDGVGPISPDEDGDGKSDPGETMEYTAVITNSGADPATGVTFTDLLDLNTTLVGGSVNVSPLAVDDSYTTIGNTLLDVGASASDPAVHVTVASIDSLFDNDTEFLGDSFTLKSVESDTTAPFTTATEQGGSVTVESDGNFSYLPSAGFSGTDNFDYVITDDGPDNVPGNSDDLTGAGRVTITVTPQRVWYVKNDAAPGGLGRSTDPFDTLAEAQAASSANDTIYVFQGNNTTTGQNTGITLKAGQSLIGEGVALTVPISVNGGSNPTTLRVAGSQPLIDNTGGFGVSVPDVSNVQIFGLNIAGSTNAVNVTTTATNSGGFEFANNTIRSAGANGIDVNGGGSGTLTVSLHDNVLTSTGNGIDIQRTAGSVNIIAFDDNVVYGNTVGTGINIVGTGATILFDANPATPSFDTVSGGTTLIGQSGNGVGQSGLVLNNIRGDLNFTDLDIYADGGTALLVNGTSPNYTGTSGTRVVANTNTPVLSSVGGPSANLTDVSVNLALSSLSSTNSATTGVSLLRVGGTFSTPSSSSITNATGVDFSINGNSNGNANVGVSYAGTITDTSGTLLQIQNVTASSIHTFSGAITDSGGTSSGVSLTGNTGATITFSGGLALSSGANAAFTATGGGTVNICDENPCNSSAAGALVNTLTTTTGTALNVANTNIGSNNLEFRSISSNGAANGIVLTSTGSSGNLIVRGDSGSSNNSSGGTIQNTTGDGISLTSTQNVSLDQMTIQSTGGSGINGTAVTSFTFTNGAISNAGNAGFESAIAFNSSGSGIGNNIAGTLTITGSTFTNAFYSGLDVQSDNGVVTNANVSNNTITNPGFSGINLVGTGNSSTSFSLNNATINQNNVSSAGGNGIQVSIGNSNVTGPGAVAGVPGDATKVISITNNSISIDATGTQAITVANSGGNSSNRTKTNFLIQCNGKNSGGCTAPTATPITGSNNGTVVLVGNNGYADMTGIINNNIIDANHTVGGGAGNGIGGGNGVAGAGNLWTPDLTLTVTNNIITDTDGNGILLVGRGTSGVARFGIRNNNVAAPLSGVRPGIRVDAGNASSADDAVCLDISGNTTSGSGGHAGIGLRKQGTVSTTNDFSIEGMSATSSTGIELFVGNTGQNPGSTNGSGDGSTTGVLLLSATSGFSNCSTVAMAPGSSRLVAKNQSEANPMVQAQQVTSDSTSVSTVAMTNDSMQPIMGIAPQNTESNTSSNLGGGKSLFRPVSAPAQSGETVGPIAIGTLPLGKSVTIKFRVTVNDPISASRILNQANVAYTGGPVGGVTTTDPSPNADPACSGTGTQTCTPTDRPDATVVSINRNVPLLSSFNDHTNATSVTWRVTFSTPISGLGTSNFTLLSGGTLAGTSITSVTAVGNTPATDWDVLVNTGSGDGLLELNMTSDAGISHDISNLSFTTGEDYTIDKTAPTTTSFTRQDPSTTQTSADVLVFRVTFSEAIGGSGGTIGAEDFTVSGTTATVTSVAFVSAGVYDIQVSGGDLAGFNGAVGLNFSPGMVIRDLAGNDVANAEPTTDETYTVDNAAPGVTLSSVTSNITNANPIFVTVQFTENVSGFSSTDIVAGNATVGNFIALDSDTYTFELTPSGQGLVTADIAAGVATDAVGNGNTIAAQFSRTFDSDAPTVAITSAASNPTNTSPIPVTVQFSENVTGFDSSDITIGNATVGNFNAVDGNTYTFDMTPSSQGIVIVDIAAGAAQDVGGNFSAAATQFSRTFDSDAPTVTMNSAASDPTNTSPISVTAQFSENVTGFTSSDVTAGNATIGNFSAVDGDTYTFDLTPLGTGLVTADISAGVAKDASGNDNSAATQFSRTFDNNAPTVTMNSAAPDPTNTAPIPVTVQFSENVTGFAIGDITYSNGSVGNFVAVDSDTYTFDLTPLTDGLVTVDIAADVAQDSSNNGNSAAAQFSRTFDTLAPSVMINQASGQTDPTTTNSIQFTVVFSEPVTGFATGDVDLSPSTTTGTLIGSVSGGPTTYTITVSGMTGDGMVIASIPVGIVTDGANLNVASTSTDNSVLYVTSMTEHLISGNVGVAGAVLSYTDGTAKTATSQVDGSYSFPVSLNWTGTVTPSHACYTFNPVSLSYSNVFTDKTAQNYTPTFDSASGCVDVDVSIGGTHQGQFLMPPQGSTQTSLSGVNTGPVKIESPSGLPFLGAEQVIYKVNGINTSFSQMMGLPNSQVYTTYWFPWYNNVDLDTQLRFGNISGSTATVRVYIGGVEMTGSPFTLAAGANARKNFAGINNGPVKIVSTQSIVVAERLIYKVNGTNTSFSEIMGLPNSQVYTTYWFPWYNNVDLDTQLRIGNASNSTATVHVYIGGVEMTGSPFTLLSNQSKRVSFAGVNNGPVKIVSTQNIVAGERVIYKINGTQVSFSELMGLPDSQVNTTYWLPWYNNADLDDQLRIGNTSGATATVHVYVGGVEMTGSPFTLLPNQAIRVSFSGVNSGPVKIESDANIVAAERVIYKVNGTLTSFSELMGLPDSLLDSIYWLPWYNNVDLNTQLQFVVP